MTDCNIPQHNGTAPGNTGIKIIAMNSTECANGCESLTIAYSFHETPFGEVMIASTSIGICSLEFADRHNEALASLRRHFPNAKLLEKSRPTHRQALSAFINDSENESTTILHLKGTGFQLKVWHSLLTIARGSLTTYRNIALMTGNKNACRAVGRAVGANPVSLLIPCHRVICTSGATGQYHWGATRKSAIIAWENT